MRQTECVTSIIINKISENASERNSESDEKSQIRSLNDQLRQKFTGGRVLITPGVKALRDDVMARALDAIRNFDDFGEDNDPYGTHEFGCVDINVHTVWFKIDAYDLNLEYGSPNPGDPDVTRRVMTILLPDEY